MCRDHSESFSGRFSSRSGHLFAEQGVLTFRFVLQGLVGIGSVQLAEADSLTMIARFVCSAATTTEYVAVFAGSYTIVSRFLPPLTRCHLT